MPVLIHCRYRIPATVRDVWVESSKRMQALSRVEEGCIGYAFSFDVADPEIAYVYEAWTTRELLEIHAKAPHHDARTAELRQLEGIDYQEITFYDVPDDGVHDMLARARPK
jgi:quinol monooxygenase YgiN